MTIERICKILETRDLSREECKEIESDVTVHLQDAFYKLAALVDGTQGYNIKKNIELIKHIGRYTGL